MRQITISLKATWFTDLSVEVLNRSSNIMSRTQHMDTEQQRPTNSASHLGKRWVRNVAFARKICT
jgi:hypothetical protein